MIHISQLKYRLILLTEDGAQYDITSYISDLGWEENERELAMRVTFQANNENTNAGRLSSLAKPGCLAGVFADWGEGSREVARGYITDWKPSVSGSGNSFEVTCYDELYYLQQSQDNIYFPAGTGTKTAVEKIFRDWNIPLAFYDGPDIPHEKLAYKSKNLSDVLLDLLDDAKKKSGIEALIRSSEGMVSVLKLGSNETVYHFEAGNTKAATHKLSTGGMVTRVKIIGQEDDEGRSALEATLDGQTQFGIRQKIYARGKDGSLEDAKAAARNILDESGVVKEDITIECPDLPFLRKGDLVHLKLLSMEGYYYIKSISHNAADISMTMDLKKAPGN